MSKRSSRYKSVQQRQAEQAPLHIEVVKKKTEEPVQEENYESTERFLDILAEGIIAVAEDRQKKNRDSDGEHDHVFTKNIQLTPEQLVTIDIALLVARLERLDQALDFYYQHRLIIEYKRRLHLLEMQQAQFGLACPSHILIDIQDINAKIIVIKRKIDEYKGII
jgi:hypothetical protein